ncbi:hypothetical protein [Azospirillum picis]|uniref:Uncharacterized protein n=1 Tax=Azospirillum picis TaxID=488438 RepID=A0ABU0MU42_9PROT|nr:hypothetical protein [Azospirillum picis]MBP2303047.1 hypothetical protein [Azospirillum picis]MDQ0536839.1 hypothetical protein [Azospirillum picis]
MRIVTGADARYFAMVGLLARSLERWLPGAVLRVCDFGLAPAQRRFLEGLGWLLPRPPSVPHGTHPYLAKAALVDYLAGDDEAVTGPLVWIDGDMVAAGPLEAPLRALGAAMAQGGAVLAACPDAEVTDIAGCIARWDVAPFAKAVASAAIAPQRPYLNSGFFLCTDTAVLEEVRDRCRRLDQHRMIDQNAFNLVAWAPGRRCGVLDPAVWNVHGRLLAHTAVAADGAVRCGERHALLLHATSIGGTHHEERQGALRGPTGDLEITVKFFRTPALAARQRELLAGFVAAHRSALVAAGCYSNGEAPGQRQ